MQCGETSRTPRTTATSKWLWMRQDKTGTLCIYPPELTGSMKLFACQTASPLSATAIAQLFSFAMAAKLMSSLPRVILLLPILGLQDFFGPRLAICGSLIFGLEVPALQWAPGSTFGVAAEFMLLAASDCLIENCWIEHCFRGGILLSTGMGIDNPGKVGSTHNVIRNCRVTACGGTGIDLAGGERNEATGCDFALIEGCHVEDIGISGIRIVRSKFVRATNNTVVRANEDSIRVDQCEHVILVSNVTLDGGSVGPIPDSNGIKFSHCLYCSAIGNVCHGNNKPNLELLNSQWCSIAHNVATKGGDWGIISRTTIPASGLFSNDILPPYQDASTREYQIQSWINTGHAIEGNLAVGNNAGGIGLYGNSNSVVSANVTGLNNQGRTTAFPVPGISVTTGDEEGKEVPSTENVVADNRSYDDQGVQTQTHGLLLVTSPNIVTQGTIRLAICLTG